MVLSTAHKAEADREKIEKKSWNGNRVWGG